MHPGPDYHFRRRRLPWGADRIRRPLGTLLQRPIPTPTVTPVPPTATPTPPPLGSRQNPVQLGTEVDVKNADDDHWRIAVIDTVPDATSFGGSYRLKALGIGGVVYTTFADSCWVIPDDLPDPELFTNGTVEGNVCWEVADDDVDSLQMFLDSGLFGSLVGYPPDLVRVTGQDLKLGGSHSLLPAGIFRRWSSGLEYPRWNTHGGVSWPRQTPSAPPTPTTRTSTTTAPGAALDGQSPLTLRSRWESVGCVVRPRQALVLDRFTMHELKA